LSGHYHSKRAPVSYVLTGGRRLASLATLLLLAQVPAKVVAERLGHSRVAFTLDTGGDVLSDLQRDAAGAMQRLLKEAAGW